MTKYCVKKLIFRASSTFLFALSFFGSAYGDDLDFLNAAMEVGPPEKICCPSPALSGISQEDPETIIFLLTNFPLRIQNILPYDLYIHTYPLIQRALQTLPSLETLLQDLPSQCWALTVKPFFRIIPRARFTKKSDNILSYITMFTQHDFVQDVDIDVFKNLNIPEVLPLFANIRLEERQLGGMVFLQAQRCNWVGTVSLPILYLENNYFLTEKQIEEIEASPLFSGDGSPKPALTPSLDYSTFTEDHLINDKAGIGDLRAEIWYQTEQEHPSKGSIGLQVTFPTAHVAFDGIIGASDSTFCQRTLPLFDLQTMVNLYIASQSGDLDAAVTLATMVSNLGISALDRLSAILLNNSLGNKHFTLGPVFIAEGELGCPNFTVQCTGDIAYYVPRSELRYFKAVKDPQSFNRNYASAQDAQKNLDFLMQAATDTLYPTATLIRVHPGFTVNLTAAIRWKCSRFIATLGYNFWGKTHEHFGAISQRYGVCDPFLTDYSQPRYNANVPLNFDAGTLPDAYQGKIFGSITSRIPSTRSFDARIGVRGDVTLNTAAIGRDMTIALDFILDF